MVCLTGSLLPAGKASVSSALGGRPKGQEQERVRAMKWRRLCVDVREDGTVIGGSVEFYNDIKLNAQAVAVLQPSVWRGLDPFELLDLQSRLPWPDGQLSFCFVPPDEF